MTINQSISNDNLMERWLKSNIYLSEEEKSIIKKIIKQVGNDLSIFYNMNKYIVLGKGEIQNKELQLSFACSEKNIYLKSSYGDIEMDAEEFRKIIAAIIDIYEVVYPVGTVVDLDKNYFKHRFNVDEIDDLRVVISHRYVPYGENMYIPYMGIHYPFGPLPVANNGVLFTPRAIKKVVHMGYSDEEEKAFLYKVKEAFIIEGNKQSTSFLVDNEYINEILNK